MRVIVTGSSGFLGRHVAGALAEAGHDVLGIDQTPPAIGAAWPHLTADLTDLGETLQLVRNAEAVVHIAAIPRPSGTPAGRVFTTNMAACYNVVEAAVLSGASRLIYASSFSVLGFPFFERPPSPAYFPLDAAHPATPQDAYALSKWLGEEVVASAVRRRPELTAVSLRMPWVQTPVSFSGDIGERRQRPELAARDLWAYLDARDAASAFLAALTCPASGHIRVFVSAADTYMEAETAPLVATSYPHAEIRRPLAGFTSVLALDEARDQIGFTPRHSWRDY